MGVARNELEARLDEVFAAARFSDRAYRLRPRIGNAIRWDGPHQEVELLRAFMVDDVSREQEIFSALLIRAVAAFERFVRRACSEVVQMRAAAATTPGTLPESLRRRNLILSARLISSLDNPREHISFDPRIMIENLAACESDSVPYRLNEVAFSSFLQSPTPEALGRLFDGIGVKDLFERLGGSTALQTLLTVRGPRATSVRIQERLGEILRWRNNMAHAGDDERSISLLDLEGVISFIRTLTREVDQALEQCLKQGFD